MAEWHRIITSPYTGSMSMSGSFNVDGNATITGNVTINGTASVENLVVKQIGYSSGSNQLGDAANDVQTLYGTVRIPTGSLIVTGSANITNGNLRLTDTTATIFLGQYGAVKSSDYPNVYLGFDANGTVVSSQNTLYLKTGNTNNGATIWANSGTVFGTGNDNAPNYKVLITGSAVSGSLNANNTLYVSGSNVGIGTSTPSVALNVIGHFVQNAGGYGIATNTLLNSRIDYYQYAGHQFRSWGPAGSQNVVTITGQGQRGKVGIMFDNPTASLHVAGDVYVSASAGTGSALTVYKSGSTVVDIQGSSGQLFSITDSLTGSLFSVNTAAGLPTIEAFSDNTVNIGKFGTYPIKVVSLGTSAVVSGSFSGSGANLSGIPASAIVGLNLSQIATGSVTASVGLGTGSFQITSGSSNFFFVSSSGNVGIGTTTPETNLHLYNPANADVIATIESINARSPYLLIKHPSRRYRVGANISVASAFEIYDENASTSRFIINTNGNITVGTTTDSGFKFDVNGTGRFANGLTNTGSFAQSGSSTFYGGTYLFKSVSSGDGGIQIGTTINGYTGIDWISNNVGFGLIAGGGITAKVNSGMGFNVGTAGTTSLGAMLGVKGSGTTSSTTSLLVQNSAANTTFTVKDDGYIRPYYGINFGSDSPSTGNGGLIYPYDSGVAIQAYGAGTGNSRYGRLEVGRVIPTSNFLGYFVGTTIGTNSTVFGATSDGGNTTTWFYFGNNLSNIVSSAIVNIDSTTKGFLPPRTNLTSNISSPAQGLQTYITASAIEGLYYYNSGSYQAWTRLLNDSGSQVISGSLAVVGTGSFTTPNGTITIQDRTDAINGTAPTITSTSTMRIGTTGNTLWIAGSSVLIGNNASQLAVTGDTITPNYDGTGGLGTSAKYWGNAYTNQLFVRSLARITGSLAISGSAGTGSALTVYKSGSTVVDIQGSQGSLMSVEDSLTGSLMSVGNISGLPLMEVFDDGTMNAGKFNVYPIKIVATGSQAVITGSFTGSFAGSINASAFTASSALVTGNVTVLGTASINNLIVNQIGYSSGSNQLGDAANDTQTLYGTVVIPTGSLTVSGSSYFSGSVGIGTAAPAYPLDVSGNARVTTLYFNNSAATGNITSTGASIEFNAPTSFGVFNFNCSGGGRRVSINGTASDTVGNNLLSIPFVVQNTTGTGRNFSMLNINPTINNTSAYTGTVWGLYYNPTITSLTGTTHRAIETTAGDVVLNGGRVSISGSAGSGSALNVYKSGSTVFRVEGSQGELFAVTDSLSGSLFSVSNVSGLPILEVFSDNTVLLGSYLDPMLITTQRLTANSGSTVIYSLPTASYDGVFVDYVIRSGSNARAGQFMGLWSGSSANFTDSSTTDFGDTTGFVFGLIVSGSNMVLTGSASTSTWTVRAGIRSI